MSGRVIAAAAIVVTLAAAGPAAGEPPQTQSKSVTATGTSQARVHPQNRNSSSSIAAAVAAARKAAITGALNDAHEYAVDYAAAAGLTLGSVISVSDQQPGFFPYGPGGFGGPFGPGQYCGTIHQVVGRPAPGTRPTFKKVHRCIVPRFAYVSLTVSYSAS